MRAAGDALQPIVASPDAYLDDARYGVLASHLKAHQAAAKAFTPRASTAPYRIWGEHLEPDSVRQLQNACSLPVAVAGALMPDAHVGYGLPIGGVLATDNAVIPYAVGVDIACRMKMTVLDLPVEALETQRERLTSVLERETCFGIGGGFKTKRQHDVMDADWGVTPVTTRTEGPRVEAARVEWQRQSLRRVRHARR